MNLHVRIEQQADSFKTDREPAGSPLPGSACPGVKAGRRKWRQSDRVGLLLDSSRAVIRGAVNGRGDIRPVATYPPGVFRCAAGHWSA